MKNIRATVLLVGVACAGAAIGLRAQELPHSGLYAAYQESGLQVEGTTNTVTAWNSSPLGEGAQGTTETRARALNRIVGTPRVMTVQTPQGRKNVLALDGNSSVWGTVQSWGSLEGERTILVLARLEPNAQGTLFDGSTLVGLSRAQIKDGSWQVGSSKGVSPSLSTKFGAWQIHSFVFRPQFGGMTVSHAIGDDTKEVDAQQSVPQGGLIVGTDATRQNGLKAEVAEILVYNRALSANELSTASAAIQKRWGTLASLGTPEPVRDANAPTAETDRTAIAAKLADTKTPLIWLWSGDSTGEQGTGQTRSVAENFAERVRWEKNRRRDIVIDQTAPALDAATINADFATRIERFHPSVVVLSPAGDASTASQLVTTIERVRSLGAIPILQSNGTNTALVQSVSQSQNVLLADGNGTTAPTPATISLSLFDTLALKDPASVTIKHLSG
ncbi:hypothetical protein IAD21_04615 [Abditibacteriota bacterium]|nr:hypothetical protein IAD21_04615 [Abditibacteriota bacterium]